MSLILSSAFFELITSMLRFSSAGNVFLTARSSSLSVRCAIHSEISTGFWDTKTFKYLGSLLINQSSIHEEIKCRLKAGSTSCYSVQTLLSSRLRKNFKIKIYKTIILTVVLNGCEEWSLTLREECRLRVFENRILRRIFRPKRNENGD